MKGVGHDKFEECSNGLGALESLTKSYRRPGISNLYRIRVP